MVAHAPRLSAFPTAPSSAAAAPRAKPAPIWSRRLLLVPTFATLVVAVLGGLSRMGALPLDVASSWVALHGPLLVCGFFGALISLERAVAVSGRWPLLAPGAALAGVVLSLAGALSAAAAAFLLASLLLLVLGVVVVRRQLAAFTLLLVGGALAWAVGNASWLFSGAVSSAVWWWVAFLVVTIAAERLELSRLVPRPPRAEQAFVALLTLFLVGLALGSLRLAGVALVGAALWLLRYDVARRTIRRRGLARYAAYALLSGFVWLGVSGALLVVHPDAAVGAGLTYDAALHAVTVGFVLAMVFAHAPIILPAVARLELRYHPAFYVPLALLHASLVARVAGDLTGDHALRAVGGMGNALTLLAFVVVALAASARRAWGPLR